MPLPFNLVRPTQLIDSPLLAEALGVGRIILAYEGHQIAGSFKIRGAQHLVQNINQSVVLAPSSGNYVGSLAAACWYGGKSCYAVMPDNSAQAKISKVKAFKGTIELIDTSKISRAERVAQLAKEQPDWYVSSPYDDQLIIDGHASLGRELADLDVDFIAVPVGGGGLLSGILTGLAQVGSRTFVVGVEPTLANDAYRSFEAGELVADEHESSTLADGARTLSLGKLNWEFLQRNRAASYGLDRMEPIKLVTEEEICQAVRLLYEHANIKAEPTAALSVASLFRTGRRLDKQRHQLQVCCVVSGGNVDADLFAKIISGRSWSLPE